MIYLELFWVYLKLGIFGFGGGYAMLSLIQDEVVNKHHWLTNQEFLDIVAVSQVTPGPIGINSATYIGYTVTGGNIFGALLTSTAVMLPSFLMCLVISRSFTRFRQNKFVDRAFICIRPASIGLIAASALMLTLQPSLIQLLILEPGTPISLDHIVVKDTFVDYKSFIIFGLTALCLYKRWIHPVVLVGLAGVVGLFIY